MAKKAIRNDKQKFKGSAGDDRNLVLVDDDFQDADFEDKVWLFWRRHGKKTVAIAALVFFAALAVIVYTQLKQMHVYALQNEYAALSTADERRAFAREHLADPMSGTIFYALGNALYGESKFAEAAADYNAAHEGQTVLAAVNGDLWMTAVHSGSEVSKKVLKVTRGVLIIDGEIWASQQIDQENLGATNAEKGTSAGNKAAFGVTSKNQPLVGSPDITVTMSVNGKTVKADGINRLPALTSVII